MTSAMTSCGVWLTSALSETKVEPFGLSLWSQQKTDSKSEMTRHCSSNRCSCTFSQTPVCCTRVCGCVLSSRPALKLQKRAMKELRAMFETTSYFDSEQITAILMVVNLLSSFFSITAIVVVIIYDYDNISENLYSKITVLLKKSLQQCNIFGIMIVVIEFRVRLLQCGHGHRCITLSTSCAARWPPQYAPAP